MFYNYLTLTLFTKPCLMYEYVFNTRSKKVIITENPFICYINFYFKIIFYKMVLKSDFIYRIG